MISTQAPDPLAGASIATLGRRLRAGETSSRQLTMACLDRIAGIDGKLASFVHVTADTALVAADAADALFAAGIDRGPLQGLPYAVKDVFDVAGLRTSCNSHLGPPQPASRDAGAVERFDAGAAVCLGKLATHEFALGGPSPELPFPPARNPHDTDRFTGASSSGSGAAVAASLVAFALGTDTSGSVRGPASACGVAGFKPSFGLVSRRGTFPLSFSLDHVGPLARSVADVARVMSVLAGFDEDDPASLDHPLDFCARLGSGLGGLTLGIARRFLPPPPARDPVVARAFDRVCALAESAGAHLVDAPLPDPEEFDACGRVLMTGEACAIHERALRERPHAFGRYTLQRIAPGAFLSAADMVRAQQVRRVLIERSASVFRACDAILMPGSLFPPPRLDAFGADWPPPPELSATRTIAANVLGAPAISIPVGLTADGLPLGLQVLGRPLTDAVVLGVAAALERCLAASGDWDRVRPML